MMKGGEEENDVLPPVWQNCFVCDCLVACVVAFGTGEYRETQTVAADCPFNVVGD